MATRSRSNSRTLPKCPTGISGLDEITGGGLPRGRPTLVCGSAGCGKTLLAIEFLVRGATEFGEPGVMMTFEETAEELAQNVRSLDMRDAGIVDRIVVEKPDAAEEPEEFCARLGDVLRYELAELLHRERSTLVAERASRYRRLGLVPL